jgi:hypothetical protein
MGRTDTMAHDPSVADRALSHEVRKRRRATSPRWRAGRNMIGRPFSVRGACRRCANTRARFTGGKLDEERFNVIGLVDGRMLFVTYTLRGETIRIISARGAQAHEKRRYHEI